MARSIVAVDPQQVAKAEASRRHARRQTITYVVFGVFVVAAAWALYSLRHDLVRGLHELTWWSVVGSFVFGAAAVWATMMSWLSAVRDGGTDLPIRDAVRIFAVGQVGKYIPGSVWPVLTQAQLARQRGASPVRVASGSLVSLAISVCTGVVFGGVLLPFSDHTAAHRLWWVPILAVPVIVALHPAVLNRLVALASRVLRRGPIDLSFSGRGVLRCVAWSVLSYLLFGAHIFLLTQALGGSGVRGFVLATCAYALASAIGIAIIFLPAGSGAREAVLTLVLAPVLTAGLALDAALVSRALIVVIDLGFGLSQVYGLRRWGVETTPVDPGDTDGVEAGPVHP